MHRGLYHTDPALVEKEYLEYLEFRPTEWYPVNSLNCRVTRLQQQARNLCPLRRPGNMAEGTAGDQSQCFPGSSTFPEMRPCFAGKQPRGSVAIGLGGHSRNDKPPNLHQQWRGIWQ